MRVTIYWPETHSRGDLEEHDELLGPESTILDVKGLIQIWTGESVRKMVLTLNGEVAENNQTLEEIGIRSQSDADKCEFSLLLEQDDDENHEGEFTHEAYIKALLATGKRASVTKETQHAEEKLREANARRIKERRAPPSVRPSRLNVVPEDNMDKQICTDHRIYEIFEKAKYGRREEGVDAEYAVTMDGEKFDFWDLRIAEDVNLRHRCDTNKEIVLEIFYFGEFKKVKIPDFFKSLVQDKIRKSVGIDFCIMENEKLRDAGCLYPLIAMPIRLSYENAETLGKTVFEHFGRPMTPPQSKILNKGGPKNGCATQ
eukprot:TRINITY_DN2861_c3_g1_i1.p1 TRINITY_DN2861_c3_g1~~TRINITY_DN2861_c3_g1_i1.p1  ORF type:complete len:315 (+),score=50.45 TRINITY_DN2861_c3_g1_i1:68-1012(+)